MIEILGSIVLAVMLCGNPGEIEQPQDHWFRSWSQWLGHFSWCYPGHASQENYDVLIREAEDALNQLKKEKSGTSYVAETTTEWWVNPLGFGVVWIETGLCSSDSAGDIVDCPPIESEGSMYDPNHIIGFRSDGVVVWKKAK